MADEFIYYPYTAPSNTPIVDQSTLKHHYFAQLSPDKRRLIPGMLQQSTRPAIGQWIDVGNVTRTFSKRYFVEYTDFNTLVPGSLIQARTLPTGKWKEVKMAEPPSNPNFHRVVFTSGYTVDDYGIVVEVIPFINNKVRPVLAALFPDLDVTTIMGNMFYFLGNYEQLIQDTSQMEPFGEAAFIKVYSPYFGENSGIIFSNMGFGEQILVSTETTPNFYTIIVQLTIPNNGQYIVMENLLETL